LSSFKAFHAWCIVLSCSCLSALHVVLDVCFEKEIELLIGSSVDQEYQKSKSRRARVAFC
jgi:hypothetical protein